MPAYTWKKVLTTSDDANYKNSNIGSSDLPVATGSAVGGIKVGSRLTMGVDGTLSADTQSGSDTTNSSLAFDTGTGVLTLTDSAGNTVTKDLDGRYITSQTDAQQLSISGQTLSLSNGGSVTLPDADTQDLSLDVSGRTVSLTNGGSVTIASSVNSTSVTNAGALMDSECADVSQLKLIDQDLQEGATPIFSTANMTDATDKRFMSNSQETKLDGLVSCTTTNVQSVLSGLDSTKTLDIGDSGNDTTVNINGNLTVSGTTTTVNTETIALADNIIELNSNYSGSTPSESGGISVNRGSHATGDANLLWSENIDRWQLDFNGVKAPIATMQNANAGAPSDSSNGEFGQGSFWMNSSSGELYVRIA